jgi:tetratricopeptide (TPR) repeat protein
MADTLNLPEMIAEARSAYTAGNYMEAARLFKAAEQSLLIASDERQATEMANNASVALLQAGEAQAAFQAVEGKEQFFEQVGDLKGLAITLGNQGAALEALKQFDRAGEAYQRAADLFRQIGENDLYTTTMQSLSAVQLRTNRPLEAVATMQAGLGRAGKLSFHQRFMKRLLDLPFRLLNR